MSDYYTIIPAQVRTDSSLSLLARLLYGDIAALASDSGECWASNTFFANEYRKDRTRVIAAIKELISAGYVRTEYRKPGNNGRVLIPCCENATTSCENATGSSENATDPLQKHNGTRRENATHNNKKTNKNEYTCACAQFWKAYPKKQDKAKAQKAFDKLRPDQALLDQILAALEWQTRSADWTKDGGRFIPLASTYINGRRWEDEPPANTTATRPSVPKLKTFIDENGNEVAQFC